MGRVKDYYWDQINAAAEAAPPNPDVEQFYADRELEKAKELLRAARDARLKEEGISL